MGTNKGKEHRFIRFFIKGFLVLLVLELAAFTFLDRFYLTDTGSYKAEKVTSQSAVKLKQVKVDSGSGVSDYQCAYDGAYISYLKSGVLTVVSLTDGKKTAVPQTSGMSILAYRWIYDRDRILIVEKSTSGGYAKLFSYNTSDKVKTEIDNAEKKQVLTLPLRSGTTSADLGMSTLTNLTYLKFTSKSDSRVYKIDVNVTRTLISTVTSSIGNIAVLKNEAAFLYEDSKHGTVYRAGSSRPLDVMGHRDLKLLGSDVNDTVYFAVPENGGTQLLYSGTLGGSSWRSIKLTRSVTLDSLRFNADTGPYAVDAEGGTLTRLAAGTRVSFKGTCIGIYNAGFFSMEGGTAYVNALPGAGQPASSK